MRAIKYRHNKNNLTTGRLYSIDRRKQRVASRDGVLTSSDFHSRDEIALNLFTGTMLSPFRSNKEAHTPFFIHV